MNEMQPMKYLEGVKSYKCLYLKRIIKHLRDMNLRWQWNMLLRSIRPLSPSLCRRIASPLPGNRAGLITFTLTDPLFFFTSLPLLNHPALPPPSFSLYNPKITSAQIGIELTSLLYCQ